jgi:hypothetical protein
MQRVNRVALEQKLGRPLLPGMQALHTCDNPPCRNPEHLYEGTQKQNIADVLARGHHFQANKTQCDNGHEFTEKNTYLLNGVRHCRACHRERSRAYRARKRGQRKLLTV